MTPNQIMQDLKDPKLAEQFAEELAHHMFWVTKHHDFDLLVNTFLEITSVNMPPRRKRELVTVLNNFLHKQPKA